VRLSEGEARARFAAVPVVRLGTADGRGRPHIVVVTFAVDGDMIYTAVDQKPKTSTALKRLRNVGENPWVTMLADEYSDDWETLWWVRADGRAAILADQRQMAAPLRLLTSRYRQYLEAPPTGPVLAVTVERWTGWTATATPTAMPTAPPTATPGAPGA
jgi:PPOX class probable F420-dependent enzyme